MAIVGRFFTGAILCAGGLAVILYFAQRQADHGGEPSGPSAAQSESATAPQASASTMALAQNAGLRINEAGLAIIKESEGLRLEAYNLNGQWLIGYGHSRTARAGMKITEAQATALLREDVRAAEDGVRKRLTVPVNENEFSAMVSLAYNLGVGGFGRSDVLKRINKGDRKGAAEAFLKYNKAGGRVLDHLTHRRERERSRFLTPG